MFQINAPCNGQIVELCKYELLCFRHLIIVFVVWLQSLDKDAEY